MEIFRDFTVVEFAGVLAGPLTGSFFSEMGARVLKVENPKSGGDITRQWKHAGESSDRISSYYAACNYDKEVLFLDLTSPESFDRRDRLIQEADVLICNHTEEKARKLGIDYSRCIELNPRLIYGNVRGFSDSDREAYDVVIQAESGIMDLNGTGNDSPLKLPVAFVDVFASHQLRSAILAALLSREKTGRGMFVEVSLMEAAISSLVNRASALLMNDFSGGFNKNEHPNIAPYGEVFESADQIRFVLAVASDRQFFDLCEILDLTDQENEFSSNEKRLKNREKLNILLKSIFRDHTFDQLSEKMLLRKIPFGKIKELKDSLRTCSGMLLRHTIEGAEVNSVKTSTFHWRY